MDAKVCCRAVTAAPLDRRIIRNAAWLIAWGGCILSAQSLPANDLMLDLSGSANRAFVDQTAGDEQGGWSDQGPTNSLHQLKRGTQTLNGIEFRILDEKNNDGKAVLTFDSEHGRSDLKQADVAVPASAAPPAGQNLNLYLLHTACWASQQPGQEIGKITAHYSQGEPMVFPVVIGRDVADWWNPTDRPNAQVTYEENNGSSIVGVYLSKFVLPAERGRPSSITLQTQGGPIWIVLAATLTDKALPLAGGSWKSRADDQWKPTDLSDLIVQPGTALDLSGLLDAPAGKHGFVGINAKGQLAFADQPDRSVRFLCDSYNMSHIGSTLAPFTDKEIEQFADQEARMGMNAVRPHNLDHFVMIDATQDGVLNPAMLDKWDRLSAALKKRGIYIYLDVTTYCLFSKDNIWTQAGRDKRFGARLYWDPQVREIWRQGATTLLTHVNPYTGLALKDEPQVFAMQTRNEAFFEKYLEEDRKNGIAPDPLLVDKFHQWLKQRYGTTEALRAAWGDALPAEVTLDNAPFPGDRPAKPVARDFTRFCIDSDQELFLWMRGVLRDIGVHVPITDFTYVPAYQLTLIRDVEPLVDMHAYHEHPSDQFKPGSSQKGLSALSPNVTMAYLTSMAGVRHLGRPMIVSETGNPFWNQWRFEGGLCWPAFAALQNWNMVCQFGQTTILTTQNQRCAPLQPFLVAIDPPRRAAQYMASMLYLRGDVKSSPHTVEVRMDRDKLLKQATDLAMPSSLSRLSLLCGLGVNVVNGPHSAPRAPYRPDLVLESTGGDQVVLQIGAANVVQTGGGTENLSQYVQLLREKNVLDSNNATDIATGVYQSDTGQILIDTRTQHIRVVTPTSEGGTVMTNAKMKLDVLSVDNPGAPAAVFLGALDHQPLQQSRRLLLLVAGDALNTDMTFLNSRRQVLKDLGRMPVLSRVLRLRISIAHQNPDQLTLWAMAFNGTRVQRIPLQVQGDTVTAMIDTGTLKGGPTPFFELTTDPSATAPTEETHP
ncbi:MAG: beta-galactosidase [Phycisphaerales bacterium]